MNILKTILCFALRLVLFMPLKLMSVFFDGLSYLCERISDGLFEMACATRQITMAPYVKDIEKACADASKRDREALLRNLE